MSFRWAIGLAVLLCAMQTNAQLKGPWYDRAQDSLIVDSLRTTFGQWKVIPSSIELQALRALSFYPELMDVHVEFIFVGYKTAHTSRPKMGTILRRRDRRCYQITISTDVPEFFLSGRQDQLPYNAQIGVLGHELGHTVHYLQQRFFGLIGGGLSYALSKKEVVRQEHATDRVAIAHGLGRQLWEWSRIAHPLLEQAGRGQNYLTPAEIEAESAK